MSSTEGVVARGRIRVDARRAVAKLRDSLLVDLHAYILEIVRCAVAVGATCVDVTYDSDDLYVRFDGSPFAASDLEHLLDFAVNDTRESTTAPQRLLALGVNAALGLCPAWVDVYTSQSNLRTRFRPELLDGDAARLCELAEGVPSDGSGVSGTCVHLRRRATWDTLRRAVSRDAPPELALALAATAHLPIPLRVRGVRLTAGPRRLLRIPLPGSFHADLIVVDDTATAPRIEYLERGVRMLAIPFPPPLHASHYGVHLPLLAVVDSDALPTNASRSALREDAGLAQQVDSAIQGGVLEAIAALTALAFGRGVVPAGVEVLDRDAVALEDALGAFACLAASARETGAALAPAALAVLDEPLLRDGIGRPLSPARALDAGRRWQLHAHRGASPLPEDFGPWMASVLWLRGRTAERLVDRGGLRDLAPLLGAIKEGAARRKRLLAHPPTGPVLAPEAGELARESFACDSGPLAGLRGEARARATGGRATVRAFVEGRLLESFDLDTAGLPAPFDLALAWEGMIVANSAYDGVVHNETLNAAIRHALHIGVVALGRTIPALDGLRGAEAESLRGLLRAGAGLSPESSAAAGLDQAAIWPTTEARWVSLQLLRDYARTTGAICVVRKGHAADRAGPAIDGRPVVAVTATDLRCLRAVAGDGVALVAYEAALERTAAFRQDPLAGTLRGALDQELRRQGAEDTPRMPFVLPGCRGWIAIANEGVVLRSHVGIPLPDRSAHDGLSAAVIDDDTIVPSEKWDSVAWPKEIGGLREAEQLLFDAVLDALSGSADASGQLTPPVTAASLETDARLRAYVLHAAARLRNEERNPRDARPTSTHSWNRTALLPLVTWLDGDGRARLASPQEVERHHGAEGPMPLLGDVPGFATFDWRPLVARDPAERAAIRAWLGDRIVEADHDLQSRRQAALAEADYRKLIATPVVEISSPCRLFQPGWPVVDFVPAQGPSNAPGVRLLVAPLSRDAGTDAARVEVLFQGHLLGEDVLAEVPVPVAARVDIASSELVHAWRELSSLGRAVVAARIEAALPRLGEALLRFARTPEGGTVFFANLAALRIVASWAEQDSAARFAFSVLFDDARAPTVQGNQARWSELLKKEGMLLPVGTERYTAWVGTARPSSALDPPILYVPTTPEGECLRRIATRLGYKLEDATSALAKLQARRRAHSSGPPRLAGTPPHPLLRADLASLKVEGAEGELELIPGPESDVAFVEGDGAARAVPADLPLPLRAIVLPSSFDVSREANKRILLSVQRAALRHLSALAGYLDELPEFVRVHSRSTLCKRLKTGKKLAAADARAPVFPDTRGRFHTLDALRANAGAALFTTLDPPYPDKDYGAFVLHLNDSERDALGTQIRLEDHTQTMRDDLEAQKRWTAPQVPSLISPEAHAQCVHVVDVDEAGCVGQVGLLSPAHADARAIEVHFEQRPVCSIADGPGWPVCACVDDATARPNPGHDAFEHAGTEEKIQRRVRAIATEAARKLLSPPADAPVSRWLENVVAGSAVVTGSLWLPEAYPLGPAVQVWSAGPEAVPCHLQGGAQSGFDASVPVAGRLMMLKPGGEPGLAEWAALGRIAWREANAMLLQWARQGGSDATLQPYRWAVALIGNQTGGPQAPTSSGTPVNARAIRAELSFRGCLWTAADPDSARSASFPGTPPAFVLLDDGGPLMQVLQQRVHKALRHLQRSPTTRTPAAVDATEPMASEAVQTETETETETEAKTDRPARSWLDAMRSRIEEALVGVAQEADPSDALRRELASVIARLPSNPVVQLAYTTRGRPVRFDPRRARLLVNREHELIARVLAAPDPTAFRMLALAALSEVNRELDAVTDAEELRALVALMERDR